jgi:hypothetical protein
MAAVVTTVLAAATPPSRAAPRPISYFADAGSHGVPGGPQDRIEVRPNGLFGTKVSKLLIAGGCSAFNIAVPQGGWNPAPDLSRAELDVDTPCGHLHVVWDASQFGPTDLIIEPGWIGQSASVVSSLHGPPGGLSGTIYLGSSQLKDLFNNPQSPI